MGYASLAILPQLIQRYASLGILFQYILGYPHLRNLYLDIPGYPDCRGHCPGGRFSGCGQCSAVLNQCILVSTSIKLVFCVKKCQKVSFRVTYQEQWLFGCLWLRSRIRYHNKLREAEQLFVPVSVHLLFK